MTTYEYKGFTISGKIARGLVEASSIKEAREKLSLTGVLAERIHATGRKMRFPMVVRALVYRELSALIKAGVPLSGALKILIDSPHIQNFKAQLAGIHDRVREGVSLADAVYNVSDSVTEYEQAALIAGEESATIVEVLEGLAAYLEEQEKLKERIRSALIYPIIVVFLGLCISGIIFGMLIPRVSELLINNGKELPVLTRCMIILVNRLLIWGPVIAGMIIFFFVLFRVKLKRDQEFRRHWDRLKFACPLWGKGYTLLVCMRFSRTMAVLLQGGVALIKSVRLSGKATGSSWVDALVNEQADAVQHGLQLSRAIELIPPLAEILPGWIKIGEESGNVGGMMKHAGARYEEYWERFLGRGLRLLEPILMLLIGGFVLLVTLSLLLPIISITKTIS